MTIQAAQLSDDITALNGKESQKGRFTLKSLPKFPADEYFAQLERYQEQFRWFTGEALTVKDDNDSTKKYPARINPIPSTVLKHAWAAFGQFSDQPGPLVRPRFFTYEPEEKELARTAEQTLAHVWHENAGRALQYENGILSQIYGGAYFKVRFSASPSFRHRYGVRLDRVMPHEVVPVFNVSNPWELPACWFVRRISAETALQYVEARPFANDEYYWIEYWTPEMFRVQINNTVLTLPNEEGIPERQEKEHPFGLTPIVYYPHVRAGSFFGLNTFDHVRALVQEFNLMVGHIGDAIAQETHEVLWTKNVSGTPTWLNLGDGIRVLNLTASRNFAPGSGSEPELNATRRTTATPSQIEHLRFMLSQYRRDAAHPSVIDGEDEGSQRSSQTLLVRLLALTSHVDTERVFMAEGYNAVNRIMLRMLEINGQGGIRPEHHFLQMWQKFSPSIPSDRKQFIDEMAIRMAHKLGSREHILSLFDDIENPEEMLAMIEQEILRWAELNRAAAPEENTPEEPKETAENNED